MHELEMRMAIPQFVPQQIDAEILPILGRVVQQHDAALRKLRQPGLEIAPYRLIGVAAVDMQQIDPAIRECRGSRRRSRRGSGCEKFS